MNDTCKKMSYSLGEDGYAFKLMCDSNLSASDKVVFWAYACLAGDKNNVHLSQKDIAQKIGMSTGTVSRAVTKLSKHGHLSKNRYGILVGNKIVCCCK